jgi:hypothetical protein
MPNDEKFQLCRRGKRLIGVSLQCAKISCTSEFIASIRRSSNSNTDMGCYLRLQVRRIFLAPGSKHQCIPTNNRNLKSAELFGEYIHNQFSYVANALLSRKLLRETQDLLMLVWGPGILFDGLDTGEEGCWNFH